MTEVRDDQVFIGLTTECGFKSHDYILKLAYVSGQPYSAYIGLMSLIGLLVQLLVLPYNYYWLYCIHVFDAYKRYTVTCVRLTKHERSRTGTKHPLYGVSQSPSVQPQRRDNSSNEKPVRHCDKFQDNICTRTAIECRYVHEKNPDFVRSRSERQV
jgi:hypothetical protein